VKDEERAAVKKTLQETVGEEPREPTDGEKPEANSRLSASGLRGSKSTRLPKRWRSPAFRRR